MEANGNSQTFSFCKHRIFLISLDCLTRLGWTLQRIEEGSPGRFARCSIQAPQLKSATEPYCHKMSERNRRKGRSELGFLPAMSLPPHCAFPIFQSSYELLDNKLLRNTPSISRTCFAQLVCCQCCVIGIRCKCCLAGWALRYDED